MKNLEQKLEADEKSIISIHLIADFEAPQFIEDADEIEKILFESAKAANNTPIKTSIHKFPGQGITGVILLAESHISIHTWPEYDYLAVDIFTCGKETQPYKALEYMKNTFNPRRVKVRLVKRGRYEQSLLLR